MQHVINRQIIELGLRSEAAAFRLQQQVSDQFHRRMMAVLERVFDALGPEGELISFDQLVVDLGVVSFDDMEDGSWMEDLYTKLKEQAAALIQEGGGRETPVRRSIGAGIVDQWLAYMRTGWLPWNVRAIDRAWLEILLGHLAADHGAVMQLRSGIAANAVMLRRIVEQHSEPFLVHLSEVLTARNQSALPAALAEVELIGRILTGSQREPLKNLWIRAIELAADHRNSRTSIEIVRALLLAVVPEQAEVTVAAVKKPARMAVTVLRENLAEKVPFCEPLLREIEERIGETGGLSAVSLPQVESESVSRDEMPAQVLNEQLAPGIREKGSADQRLVRTDQRRALEEGVFVPYAGMVLIHPFLVTFFTRVGLVMDNAFVSAGAQLRGVHLLQYVVTGETDSPEYELLMSRVLCALPLEEPVERVFQPSAAEMEETHGLLDACLGQWTKLGNTSRTGLRESFLNRPGRLLMKNDRLRLEVERSSIDVLLDYLPWGLGLVRLPWMKEVLHVSWR